MPDHADTARRAKLPLAVCWFIGIELLCFSGFVLQLIKGTSWMAAVFLVGPFQLLAWSALAGNEQALLVAFVTVLPFAGADLLPRRYEWFVYYPSTIVLLGLSLMTRDRNLDSTSTVRLRKAEYGPIVVFTVWTVVSCVNSVLRGWGTHYLIFMTVFTCQIMFIAYFVATAPHSLDEVRTLVYVVVGATALTAVCLPLLPSVSATMTSLGGKVVMAPAGRTSLNIVACSLTTVAAVGLGMAVFARRVATRVLLVLAASTCAAILVFTKSRGAWLGFGAAFLYILLRTRSLKLLLFGAGSGLVLTASDFLRAVLASRAGATSAQDPSLVGRLLLWYYAWRVGVDNWLFGVGLENFRYVKHFYHYPQMLKDTLQYNAHNIYLEILADLGLVGLVSFCWLLVGAFVRSSRAMGPGDSRDLGLGISAGLVALSVHGLVDAVMLHPGEFALLGVLVGLSISVMRLSRDAASRQSRMELTE